MLSFIAAEGAYYFLVSDGRRGDIAKCRTLQPPIHDQENFRTYLWVQAVQGYFLLCQHFLEGKAGEWRLVSEIEIEEGTMYAFDEIGDLLLEQLQEVNLEPPTGEPVEKGAIE